MDNNLNNLTQKLERLSNLKNPIVITELSPVDDPSDIITNRTLVGKLLCGRQFKNHVISIIVSKAWKPSAGFMVLEVDFNKFVFTFANKREKQKVLSFTAWTINGAPLIIKPWDPSLSVHDIDFSTTCFWVQVHGLPPLYVSKANAIKIGSEIGNVLETDINPFRKSATNFFSIKVELDIYNPLKCVFFHSRPPPLNALWIQFKYERMAQFCFKCGTLGHVMKWCKESTITKIEAPDGKKVQLYGPWMNSESTIKSCFHEVFPAVNSCLLPDDIGPSPTDHEVEEILPEIQLRLEKLGQKATPNFEDANSTQRVNRSALTTPETQRVTLHCSRNSSPSSLIAKQKETQLPVNVTNKMNKSAYQPSFLEPSLSQSYIG
ncbi:Zinc CCHC-type-like protein [Quillaja saponaria]|uniref:Zinc CCHC-type-like protein n=1 Tax=Quillaja saponaria TaxID=32244 RepID=A0AAD7PNN8_QUISA|nr:Zinc CCHC-type-like protein [Quillaja saponaria]